MADEEILGFLSSAFTKLKQTHPAVSYRVWHEEGEIRFFLTNLPYRKRRNVPRNQTAKTSKEDYEPPPPPTPSPPPLKRRKKRGTGLTSTPDPFLYTPEQLRDDRRTESLQLTTTHEDRQQSFPSIPCSNTFAVLANLEDSVPTTNPIPQMECVHCNSTFKQVTNNHYDLLCNSRVNEESACSVNPDNIQMMVCKCDPSSRFLCVGCSLDPVNEEYVKLLKN